MSIPVPSVKPEKYLDNRGIIYVRHEHPAVFSVSEAQEHIAKIPGMACKNLFLRVQKKRRYLLVIIPAPKRAALKELGKVVGIDKLTFASPEDMQRMLSLTPGSVSPFGLINDIEKQVELWIDREVRDAPIVTFHPNDNRATLELTQDMFQRYLDSICRPVNILL